MSTERSVKGHTALTCTNKLFGFTAGVKLLYRDIHGNTLGTWPHAGNEGDGQWGINQAPIIGANHRNLDWFDSAPEGTATIELIQFWADKDRFPAILAAVSQVASELEAAAKFIVTFAQQHPELVTAVTAVIGVLV